MFIRTFALAIFAMSLLAQGARGDNDKTAAWGQVGGWGIRVDQSLGNGCFAGQLYEDGTCVRMGFDLKKKSIFIMLGNAAWRSIEAGKVYQMTFVFDEQQKYSGEMVGVMMGDKVFLDHSSISTDFAKDFMERSTVRVGYRGSQIAHLSLRNTFAAMG